MQTFIPNLLTRFRNASVPYAPPPTRRFWAGATLVFLTYLFVFRTPIRHIVSGWTTHGLCHGSLIFLISLGMVWHKRHVLRYLPVVPNLLGGSLILLAAVIAYVTGWLTSILLLQDFSVLIALAGLVWLLLGDRFLCALLFPIVYLTFMLPIFDELLRGFSDWFQLTAARIAVVFFSAIGMPVFRHEKMLYLPHITIEVARACNGINHIIALMALAIPLAYMTQSKLWRRAALVVAALLISLGANGMRVGWIGIWSYFFGKEGAHGPWHVFMSSFVIAAGAVGLVFVTITTAERVQLPKVDTSPDVAPGGGSTSERQLGSRLRIRRTTALFFGILISLLPLLYFSAFYPLPSSPNVPLESLPGVLGEWQQGHVLPAEPSYRARSAHRELMRLYTHSKRLRGHVYIAYYDKQEQGTELVNYFHDWLHNGATQVSLEDSTGKRYTIKKTEFKQGGQEGIAFFCYVVNGRILTGRYSAKLASLADALLRRRTNGALVVVAFDRPRGPLETGEKQQDLRGELVASVMAFAHNL